MSGDVQPRKRKDKRRKKGQLEAKRSEEYQEERAVNFSRQNTEEGLEDVGSVNPDEVIHIQKDALLGGNICAKVVFFCLLGAIGVMVGLIIVEYRGSKEVDIVSDENSQWSQMLEGWVDSSSSHHDEHEEHDIEETSGEEHSGENELHDDEGHKDDEDHDDGDDHDEEDHDDDHQHLDEEEEDDLKHDSGEDNDDLMNDASEEEDEEEEEAADDEDQDDEEEEENDQEASEEDIDGKEIDDIDDDDKYNESNEADDGLDDDRGEEDDDDDDEVFDIPGVKESEENDYEGHEHDDEKNDLSEEENFAKADDDDNYNDDDGGDDDDDDGGDDDDSGGGGDDEEDERIMEEKEDNTGLDEEDIEEVQSAGEEHTEGNADESENEGEEETSGVALKFGVGVALVVVAHVVLVRKWNSAGEEVTSTTTKETNLVDESEPIRDPEIVPENLSRRQTLVAPPAVEELPDVKAPETEYSDGEELEDEDDDSEKIKQTLEELKKTYSHLTPEGSDVETEEEQEDEEEYDYDPRVASKNYTSTQTPSDSEPEQSEPEDDEGKEDEEDDPMGQWQSGQSPHLLAEEVEDVQTGSEEEEESDDEPPSIRRKGPLDQNDLLPESEPESQSYVNADTTNNYDWDFHEDLDGADWELNEGHAENALNLYTSLLARAPYSPRAHYGKAKALDHLAEKQRSNQLLVESIKSYSNTLNMPDIPDKLFLLAANRTIDRMRFKGMHLDAVNIHNKLIAHFHDNPLHRSQLAITYLMINRLGDAKVVLDTSLHRWPKDGLSNCLYGLLLKLQGNHTAAVPHLILGINSNENGTQESNFYFHLGDALVRNGQPEEAMKIYEKGTAKGLFRSKYQRSLYNVDRLTARPWWTPELTTYKDFFMKLEANWKNIRDEGLAALKAKNAFLNESESLRKIGDWKQFEIFARGHKSIKNCQKASFTCQLIESFAPASGCRRGQTKFSVLEGGTHVWAHCGPTNCRLRAHLGLVVPPNTFIRVADETRSWQEGKVIIFDDSFEHEVWHNGTEQRLVLIVDVWHPELTQHEKQTLSAI